MMRNGVMLLPAAVLALGIAGCGKRNDAADGEMGRTSSSSMAGMADTAMYRIVFHSTWTRDRHPTEYPSGSHFSGLIGAAHDSAFSLFAEGMMPTPGIERLSEMGRHSPLDEELRAAMTAGHTGALFTTGPLRDFGDSLVATVRLDGAHPFLSFAAMIAPSPDWFTGANNVRLMENGAWVTSRTLTLDAWDSGGDDGLTYTAADRDTAPKKPTARSMSRHFVRDGAPVPVASVTITKL